MLSIDEGIKLEREGRMLEAETVYRRLIDDSQDVGAYIRLVFILLDDDRSLDALKAAEALAVTRPHLVEGHWLAGVCRMAMGEPREALEEFRNAAQLDPDDTRVLVDLGYVQEELGMLDSAVECYERAVEIDPADPVAHYNLGIHADRNGDLDAAEREYRLAVAADSHYAEALWNLAVTLRQKGQIGEAKRIRRRARELGGEP